MLPCAPRRPCFLEPIEERARRHALVFYLVDARKLACPTLFLIRLAPLIALAVLLPQRASSQSSRSAPSTQSGRAVAPSGSPIAQAVRRTHAINIDGRLDDADWSSAPAIATFIQTQPTEGAPATQRTEVRVLFDDEAIYIGARMYDSQGAHGVHARLARRDALLDINGPTSLTSDKLTITLDAYHDHLSQAMFQINPYGVIGDALGEGGSNLDGSWNPIWEGAPHIDSLGWTAELRFPLSQLGYAVTNDRIWGMQIERLIDRLNERDVWAFWRANEAGGPARFGSLTGVDVPPHRRNVAGQVRFPRRRDNRRSDTHVSASQDE